MSKNRRRNRNKAQKEAENAAQEQQNASPQGAPGSPNVGAGLQTEGTRASNLQGVYTPMELYERGVRFDRYEVKDDVFVFIWRWLMTAMCLFIVISIIILIWSDKLRCSDADRTWSVVVLALWATVFTAAVSATLALKELSELLTYIFKCASIINFFIIAAFMVIIFYGNNWFKFDKTFVKIMTYIMLMYLVSIISAILAWYIRDPNQLRVQVSDFFGFILRYIIISCVLVMVLVVVIFVCGNNLLGINFDETFFKLALSSIYMLIHSGLSALFVMFCHGVDWRHH